MAPVREDGQDSGMRGKGARDVVRRLRARMDQTMIAQGERSALRVRPHFPYSIRLDHPPTAELRPRYGFGRPSHQRLEEMFNGLVGGFDATLRSFGEHFNDLAKIPLHGVDSPEPCWIHKWLIGLDTVSLYSFIRSREPAQYVEVGSGQSTKLVARARSDGGFSTRITSIDPSPRTEVDVLCDRVIRSPLETIDLVDAFGTLGPGDVVFFDGSHRVFPNSDCVAFFLDVLPSLPPRVLVGIHDIYLPDDYPLGFIETWWSEQYLLAALLLGRPSWLEITLPAFYATGRPELAEILEPLFGRPELSGVNRRGSVFWVQTTERP